MLAAGRVRAACSTRAGGVSAPPYDSLNLGAHVGDDAAHVQSNRAAWARHLGARPVYLQQVHGTAVVALSPDTPDGAVADACVSTTPGLACTIMVADCLPVLLASADGRAVAAAHAGWRGLAAGVIEAAHQALRERCGTAAAISAWLGPCIGPQAFEVGDEVREAFVVQQSDAGRCFARHAVPGKWWADLQGLARMRLASLGVRDVHGNDGSPAWCTHADASRFFSHRRDRVSGRFAASVWIDSRA